MTTYSYLINKKHKVAINLGSITTFDFERKDWSGIKNIIDAICDEELGDQISDFENARMEKTLTRGDYRLIHRCFDIADDLIAALSAKDLLAYLIFYLVSGKEEAGDWEITAEYSEYWKEHGSKYKVIL